MKLLIDIGNTRIKWAFLVNKQLRDPRALLHKDLNLQELLGSSLLRNQQPGQVYIANVADRSIGDRIAAAIKKKWGLAPVFVEVKRRSRGVTNAYRDITQLGIDRWLAVVAAWNRYRAPVCIVNCGTAVTIDGVSKSGRHMGGLIVPGLNLMQGQLTGVASGIKLEPNKPFELKFGRTTTECVNNGAGRAIVGLIDHVVAEMTKQHGKRLACIITGGDGERINALLQDEFTFDPHLVLHGLSLLAEKNK